MGLLLNYSSIKDFKNCRKRYWFSEIENLAPKYEGIDRFFIGSTVHEAIAKLYRGEFESLSHIDKWIESECDQFEEWPVEQEIIYMMQWMVREYYDKNYCSDLTRFNILGIEVPFQIDLSSLQPIGVPISPNSEGNYNSFYFYGTLDGLFEDKDTGDLYVHEIKTMSTIGGGFLSALMMDEQTTFYCWLVSTALKRPVRGVAYSIIKKDYPRPPAMLKKGGLSTARNQNTNYDMYKQAIIDNNFNRKDYKDILEYLFFNQREYVKRGELFKSEQDILDIHKQIQYLSTDMYDAIKYRKSFYRNPAEPWRGGCLCSYKSICIDDTVEGRMNFVPKEEHYPTDVFFNELRSYTPHLLVENKE